VNAPPPADPPAADTTPYYRFRPDGRPPELIDPAAGGAARRDAPDGPAAAAGFISWLGRVGAILRRSWRPLAVLQLGLLIALNAVLVVVARLTGVGFTPATGLDLLLADPGALVLLAVLQIAVSLLLLVLVAGACTYVVVAGAAGRPVRIDDALGFSMHRVLPATGWAALVVASIVVGLVLLVLPGLCLAVVFSPLVGVLFVERATPARCIALVRRRFLPTAGRLLCCGVPVLLSITVSLAILTALDLGSASPVAIVLEVLLGLPAALVQTAGLLAIYIELREREHPGASVDALAAEMAG
jgi:hypothetical protein